jgi:hypothetical protein
MNAIDNERQRTSTDDDERQGTLPYKDKEKEYDKDNTKESVKPQRRFTPPTVEDVAAYCKERNNHVDPEKFVDFYASKGWKVGNQGMSDWKACVRTWEKRDDRKPDSLKKVIAQNYDQRDYAGVQDELIERQRNRIEARLKDREVG